jgi:tripartite-type tricarboxylate transporter receptor subunit TctC
MTSVLPFIDTGRLKVLGISTQEPSALLPNVSPVALSGATGYEVKGWYGVLAPAGTPVKIIDFLNKTLRDVFADTTLREKLAKQGVELNGSSPEQATKFIADETEKWRKVIQETGIKAN